MNYAGSPTLANSANTREKAASDGILDEYPQLCTADANSYVMKQSERTIPTVQRKFANSPVIFTPNSPSCS